MALIFVGLVIVAIVFLRRQWARSEENKARINARLAGEDEILVSSNFIFTCYLLIANVSVDSISVVIPAAAKCSVMDISMHAELQYW